jgi:hypothetical protein
MSLNLYGRQIVLIITLYWNMRGHPRSRNRLVGADAGDPKLKVFVAWAVPGPPQFYLRF